MYKIATTLLCLHLVFALYGQNYSVKTFKKSGFQCSSMGISVYSNSDIRNNNADPIILKNNYILKDYNSCSLTIQNVTPNVYNILKILVGYKGEDMVMVFDNNHNLTFKDDSVYTHRIKKDSFSDKDLRNQLPEIKIDSLEYVDSNGIRLYFSRLIKFCPTLKISEATRGYNSMLKSSKIKLIVFSDSAFISEKFKIGMDDYHIEIVPHPFIFSVYPIMRSRFAASFSLVRNYPNDSTSVAGFGLLEDIIQNRKPIYFEKKQIRIGSFDSCADSLFFSISDKSATADSINSS